MTEDILITEVREWLRQPLCCQYLVVLFDALRVQVQEGGAARDKTIYLGLGMLVDGSHEVIGLWNDPAPGAIGWRNLFVHLKHRGVEGIRFFGIDAPKGLATALRAAFPAATLQPSIAQLICLSLSEATAKDRQPLAAALRPIYAAGGAAGAQAALAAFAAGPWGAKYPAIVKRWRAALKPLAAFFALAPQARRTILWAVHLIEDLHQRLSRAIGRHGPFAGEQQALVVVWLALQRELRGARLHEARAALREARTPDADKPAKPELARPTIEVTGR
jgi:putative transposase